MRFVVDMNLSPGWVATLANAGWPTTHWSEIGKADANDAEIFQFAAANDYTIFTHDLDFGTILAITRGKKPSVVQIRAVDISPESIGAQIVAALTQAQSEIEAGALLTIEPGRTRLRILPLRLE